MKKVLYSGGFYFLIALMFIAGAISKTISSDSIVIGMLWFCALVFAIMGALRLRKNAIG